MFHKDYCIEFEIAGTWIPFLTGGPYTYRRAMRLCRRYAKAVPRSKFRAVKVVYRVKL